MPGALPQAPLASSFSRASSLCLLFRLSHLCQSTIAAACVLKESILRKLPLESSKPIDETRCYMLTVCFFSMPVLYSMECSIIYVGLIGSRDSSLVLMVVVLAIHASRHLPSMVFRSARRHLEHDPPPRVQIGKAKTSSLSLGIAQRVHRFSEHSLERVGQHGVELMTCCSVSGGVITRTILSLQSSSAQPLLLQPN